MAGAADVREHLPVQRIRITNSSTCQRVGPLSGALQDSRVSQLGLFA